MVALGGEGMVRHLLKLWCYAAEHKQNGTLSNMEDLDISLAADYDGPDFVEKVIAAGFIDDVFPRKLHDWKDHQGWIVKAPERKAQAKRAAAISWESRRKRQRQPHADSNATSNAESNNQQYSLPTPNPTLPNLSLGEENVLFGQIITDLNSVTKRSGRQMFRVGEKVKSDIRARLKDGYKLDDFKHVHRVKAQEWTGSNMEVHLNPGTLYRKSNFPNYVAQKMTTTPKEQYGKPGPVNI